MTYDEFENWILQDVQNVLVEAAVRSSKSREAATEQAIRISKAFRRTETPLLPIAYDYYTSGITNAQLAHDDALRSIFITLHSTFEFMDTEAYYWSIYESILNSDIGNSNLGQAETQETKAAEPKVLQDPEDVWPKPIDRELIEEGDPL